LHQSKIFPFELSDNFLFFRWATQALGPTGFVLGFFPLLNFTSIIQRDTLSLVEDLDGLFSGSDAIALDSLLHQA
jgi:hypothetical protein